MSRHHARCAAAGRLDHPPRGGGGGCLGRRGGSTAAAHDGDIQRKAPRIPRWYRLSACGIVSRRLGVREVMRVIKKTWPQATQQHSAGRQAAVALALHTFATFGTAFQFKCSQEPRNQFRGLPNHSRSFPSHSQFSVRSRQRREPPLPPLDHTHSTAPPTPAAAQAAPTNTAAACARLPSPSLRGAARRCFDLRRQKKQLLTSLKLISLLSHTSTMAEGEPCFPLHNNLPPCEKQPIQPRFARLGLPYVFTKPPHHLLIHDLPITSRITFFNFVCSRSRPPRPRPLRLLCRRRNFCSLPPFRFLQRHLRPHH